ncbi:Ig-like domain-containing protein [Deinococcus lacus]|uniref:Ig-like domain-containing protein n=1 Tax=Deinococcus lacus TaxID=392561 RepID=A0ABW1YFF5_9DEIO
MKKYAYALGLSALLSACGSVTPQADGQLSESLSLVAGAASETVSGVPYSELGGAVKEIKVEVYDAYGQLVRFNPQNKAVPGGKVPYLVLQPGQSVKVSLSPGHVYRIISRGYDAAVTDPERHLIAYQDTASTGARDRQLTLRLTSVLGSAGLDAEPATLEPGQQVATLLKVAPPGRPDLKVPPEDFQVTYQVSGGAALPTPEPKRGLNVQAGADGETLDVTATVTGYVLTGPETVVRGQVTGTLRRPVRAKPVPDTQAPSVSLSVTPAELTQPGSVTLLAGAQDDWGVSRVDFYDGEQLLGSDAEQPYTLEREYTAADNGDHSLRAVAYDAAGNQASAAALLTVRIPVVPPVPKAGVLAVDLVRSNRGAAVEGSLVEVFRAGDRSQVVARAETDLNGYAEFAGLDVGRYDLVFRKAGFAASEVFGAPARPEPTRLKVAQFEANNPYGDAVAPALTLLTPTGLAEGQATGWKTLSGGETFRDLVYLRSHTAASNPAPLVMRYFLHSLVTFGPSGEMSDLRGGVTTLDPGFVEPGPAQDSGLVTLPDSGLEGEIFVQVVGLDYNNNRSAYLVPVTLERSGAAAVVQAPSDVRAVAYTNTQPVSYIYGIREQAAPQAAAAGTNVWVNVSWAAPASLEGVRGFRVLRAEQAEGPYQQVAFTGTAACKAATNRCSVSDSSATLKTGQDYFYRVAALGSEQALSAAPTQPSTHTMPAFAPQLLSPGAEENGTDWLPTYTVKANLDAAQAHGARFDLRVSDMFTGRSHFDAPGLWLERRGSVTVRGVDSDASRTYLSADGTVALVKYDPASDILSVPHDLGRVRYGLTATPLQSARRYSWMLNRAFAFRLADPAQPQSETNPVVAYSVYSDPDSTKVVPDGATQSAAAIHHFITKP